MQPCLGQKAWNWFTPNAVHHQRPQKEWRPSTAGSLGPQSPMLQVQRSLCHCQALLLDGHALTSSYGNRPFSIALGTRALLPRVTPNAAA